MENSKIVIRPGDKVIVKQAWKPDVFHVTEVKKILEFVEDNDFIELSFGHLSVEGMRPVEVSRLFWHKYEFNSERDTVLSLRHDAYKPTNQILARGNKQYTFKELKKPIWSKWLSDKIIRFAQTHAPYESNKVFPWRTSDPISNWFKDFRRNYKSGEYQEMQCLMDRMGYDVQTGKEALHYRCNPYSFRRFSISFHHHVTFKGDFVATAKMFGHNTPDTTFRHYIRPKEMIGLTQKMIDNEITWDEFVYVQGNKQRVLREYLPEWNVRFVPAGQMVLQDWT